MKTSIRQISQITGFSIATVSNALNGKKGVNKETAEKILKVAKAHGYLSERKITNINFVICKKSGDIISDTPFFSALIEGVEMESRKCGYRTVIQKLDQSSVEYESILEGILNDGASGILLLATELSEEDIKDFERAVSPLVIVDSWYTKSKFDAVLINNTDSVTAAVEYLIGKGHREIGYLKSQLRIKNFTYRAQGYRRALLQRRIPINEEFQVKLTPTTEGAYRDMDSYLRTSPKLPTAFVADNDIIALAAIKALKQHGYKVPQDISVIGFDDLPFCNISSPSLTTVRVFKQDMGRLAVRKLIDRIQNGVGINTKTEIGTEFIERDSVCELKKSNGG
ncbi:LacI family transcriptional regulator [Sporanaerobium hydrogeniformans]|uniref:LacI family transcriptional regulator n=1 Tax=Sporanaerobium hydrogeniformans TaxID=3072179 RepID=A0AC61DCG0_9FIRM|nr:LacI family DNA-binding transcriptional regulator [Sporanaerobium hydrogeniformans]PHV70435.1 LacI family transcriptional regulator [Sporanaerobium hydrogeniformans]